MQLVDSLDKLPLEARAEAKPIYLQQPSPPVNADSSAAVAPATSFSQGAQQAIDALPEPLRPAHFDVPSFALGFGSAGALALLVFLLGKGSKLAFKAVAMVAVVALVGGVALGLLRRSVGQGSALVATPSSLVEDARRAVRALEARQLKQQQLLDELSSEPGVSAGPK